MVASRNWLGGGGEVLERIAENRQFIYDLNQSPEDDTGHHMLWCLMTPVRTNGGGNDCKDGAKDGEELVGIVIVMMMVKMVVMMMVKMLRMTTG